MSSIAWSLPTARQPRAVHWGSFALVALGTITTAVVANVVVYVVGGAVVDYDPRFQPLATVGPTILFTLVPAIGATLLDAVLRRHTDNPASILAMIAAVVFAVSLIPVFTAIPSVPGATVGQTSILILMHAVVANAIIGVLTICSPRPIASQDGRVADQRRR